jgi:ABC-type dipeptide/oligopeptide/nickel transport system permease subunit
MHDTVMVLKNFHHRSSRLISGRKMVFFSASVALFIGVIALAAPVLAPHDPTAVDLAAKLKYPSFAYPFGTDHLGRCILSRIIFGARVSLKAAAIVVVISASTGTLLGVISGYFGGLIDRRIRDRSIMQKFNSSPPPTHIPPFPLLPDLLLQIKKERPS